MESIDTQYTIRAVKESDIDPLLALMRPFIKSGVLLPRTREMILERLGDYSIAVSGDVILGEMALHVYSDNTGELAAVVINPAFEHQGIGGVLMAYMIDKGRALGLDSLFLLTISDPSWYKKFGFQSDTVDSLPPQRKKKWDPVRGSKVFRLRLK